MDAGITPAVTLYHWDLPEALNKKGGWQSMDTTAAFANFADIMFEALGDKVKIWFTINEPVSAPFASTLFVLRRACRRRGAVCSSLTHL